jgi:hypothetical protein
MHRAALFSYNPELDIDCFHALGLIILGAKCLLHAGDVVLLVEMFVNLGVITNCMLQFASPGSLL